MKYKTKSLNLLLHGNDEHNLQEELSRDCPDILFIDGQRWDTPLPPAQQGLNECKGDLIYIWNPKDYPELPYKELASGKIQGPTSGLVIQYRRCNVFENRLTFGDIGVGYRNDDILMDNLTKSIWKAFKKINVLKIHKYIVGKGAFEFYRNGGVVPEIEAFEKNKG